MVLSSQGVSLLVWIAVFTPVTTIIIILRLLAAKIKKRTMRLDDWTIMGAYVSWILGSNHPLNTATDQYTCDGRHSGLGYFLRAWCAHSGPQKIRDRSTIQGKA